MNHNTVTQMAAVSSAMRMLLAGDQLAKPDDLMIAACSGVTDQIIRLMMSHATDKRSTFLLIFHVDDDTALLDKVMIVDASTKKSEINIGGGKFVRKKDGSFAIRSINNDEPYEYSLTNAGRRLVRRSVDNRGNRALMEIHGLQELIAKAVTPECQEEAAQRSIYPF